MQRGWCSTLVTGHLGARRGQFAQSSIVAGGGVAGGRFLGYAGTIIVSVSFSSVCLTVSMYWYEVAGIDVFFLHRLGHDRGHLPQQLFAGRRGIKRNQVVHVAFGEVLLKCRNHGLHNFVPGHIVEHLVRSRGHLGFVVGG